MPSVTHIVPVAVGDPEKCKAASDLLLERTASTSSRSIIRPCPRAPSVCASRRRPITTTALIDALADALVDVWQELDLPLRQQMVAE